MNIGTTPYLKQAFPGLLKISLAALLGYWVGRESAFDAIEAVVYDQLSMMLSYINASVTQAGGLVIVLLAAYEIFHKAGGRRQ